MCSSLVVLRIELPQDTTFSGLTNYTGYSDWLTYLLTYLLTQYLRNTIPLPNIRCMIQKTNTFWVGRWPLMKLAQPVVSMSEQFEYQRVVLYVFISIHMDSNIQVWIPLPSIPPYKNSKLLSIVCYHSVHANVTCFLLVNACIRCCWDVIITGEMLWAYITRIIASSRGFIRQPISRPSVAVVPVWSVWSVWWPVWSVWWPVWSTYFQYFSTCLGHWEPGSCIHKSTWILKISWPLPPFRVQTHLHHPALSRLLNALQTPNIFTLPFSLRLQTSVSLTGLPFNLLHPPQ